MLKKITSLLQLSGILLLLCTAGASDCGTIVAGQAAIGAVFALLLIALGSFLPVYVPAPKRNRRRARTEYAR